MHSRATNTLVALLILGVIPMTWSRTTLAALEASEHAYEVDAAQVLRWPLGDDGSLVLRPCRACDPVTLGVNAQTTYRVSGSSLNISREELLRLKSMLINLDEVLVYIFYRPDERVATRIVLDPAK